jgi:DNA-directed RNA polymerase specialized sigma24 family protein
VATTHPQPLRDPVQGHHRLPAQPPPEGTPPTEGDASSGTPTINRVPAPEPDLGPVWDEEWHRNLVDAALQRVKARVTPRQYQIFDLYVVKGWPVAEVKRTLNVSTARVYLAKHRLARLVREKLRRLEQQCGQGKSAIRSTPPENRAQ